MEKREKEKRYRFERFGIESKEDFTRAIETMNVFIREIERRKEFLSGIFIGLFYGIVGNIAVSHYYKVLEGLVIGKMDNLFWVNLTVLIVTSMVIIVLSFELYTKLRALKSITGMVKSILEPLEKELQTFE